MGVATERHLRWVRERNTAGLSASETARYNRLVAYGAVRVSKRGQVDRETDAIWAEAEKRIVAEITAAKRQEEADRTAKAEKKVKASRESRWW